MNKKEALAKVKDLKVELEKLKKIIELDNISIDDIKGISDLCKILNIKEDEVFLFDEDTKDPLERYLNACRLIPLITKIYNEGVKIDFSNSSQYKYLPYYRKVVGSWVFYCYCGWCMGAYGSVCHHYTNIENLKKACKVFNKFYIDYYSYTG